MHVYLLEGKRLCEKHKREENSHSFSTCGSLKIKKECLFLNRHTKYKVWGLPKWWTLCTWWAKGPRDPSHQMTKGTLMYQMTKRDPFVPDNSFLHINTIWRWPLVIFYYFSYFIFSDHSFPSLTSSLHLSKKVSKCIPVTASNAPKHLTNDKTNAIPRYPVMENNTDKPYTWNGFWNIKITHQYTKSVRLMREDMREKGKC